MTDQSETPVGGRKSVEAVIAGVRSLRLWALPDAETTVPSPDAVRIVRICDDAIAALKRLPLLERVVEAAREYGNAPRFSTRKETGFEVHTREVELFRPVIDALSLLDTQQETHG